MLQPTDRVAAKVLTKMLGDTGAFLVSMGIPGTDIADLFALLEAKNVGDNPALNAALKEIREEVIAEKIAEKEGRAVPNTPYPTDTPQPFPTEGF